MFRDDYLLKQIEVMVKYIAETVLRKNKQSYNITAEKFFESNSIGKDLLYLVDMVDNGEINLAENLLFEKNRRNPLIRYA